MSDERNTAMLPRIESRIQVICGLKAAAVANCGHLQNQTAERLARRATRTSQKFVTDADGDKGVRKRLGGQIDLLDNISFFRVHKIVWVNHPIGQQDEQ